MNNRFDERNRHESAGNLARSIKPCVRLHTLCAGLALLVALPVTICSGDTSDRSSDRVAITGTSDWSIVPAAIVPPYVFNGTDGDFYIRHLPLVGRISLSGRGVSIEGKISADFNAELDATFSGPLWAPVVITGTINGSKTVLFDGNATGNTVGLVSVGVIKLDGRGPFEGARLVLEFTEIGPGNTDTYNLRGVLVQCCGH
jgi:hypothetical protein